MLAAQQGRDEEAITAFKKSLSSRPKYATALLNLGNLYRRQGKLDEAEKYLADALASEPMNAEVNYNLGMYMPVAIKQIEPRSIWRPRSVCARITRTR